MQCVRKSMISLGRAEVSVCHFLKNKAEFPFWSSGEDSTLPVQQARVKALVRELRSQIGQGQKKKKKVENKK